MFTHFLVFNLLISYLIIKKGAMTALLSPEWMAIFPVMGQIYATVAINTTYEVMGISLSYNPKAKTFVKVSWPILFQNL